MSRYKKHKTTKIPTLRKCVELLFLVVLPGVKMLVHVYVGKDTYSIRIVSFDKSLTS